MEQKVEEPQDLLSSAKNVLEMNDRGNYTQPAHGLYPHQWLWDSCFIAIGLRHLDVERAKMELLSLQHGQWHNGMLPNIIFRNDPEYRTDRNLWRSWLNPFAPNDVTTTGITQPPVLAEAVVRVGEKMGWPERRQWYNMMYPTLLSYHQWMYRDRDPHKEGLILLVHPWEAGLDNTPPWMAELHQHQLPSWIRLIETLKLDKIINLFRRDLRSVPLDQRFDSIEAIAMFDIQLRLRRKAFDINKILDHAMFSIEDLNFNSILIRNNTLLQQIAKSIKEDLPDDLVANMKKTENALEELWDPYTSQYYSRDFTTHRLLKTPSIATLLPLYAGNITKERAEKLVNLIKDRHQFGATYPVPSVPMNSEHFSPKLYWQGPSWVNTNWLIIDGLKRYGYDQEAEEIAKASMEMVNKSGCYEYFDPYTGEPAGAANFSWTAALAIDLLKTSS